MLTVNIDIQNRLINGLSGNIRHIEFGQGTVHEQTGLKGMRSDKILEFPLKNVKLRFQ